MEKEIQITDLNPRVMLKSKVNDVNWAICQVSKEDGIYLALFNPDSAEMITLDFNSIEEVNVYLRLA